MKYVMCPNCGKKLCKGEAGTRVEVDCPKCGETVVVIIKDDDMRIVKPTTYAALSARQ